MKSLLLLRHAKAAPAEEPLADINRPLAPRGERDARHIGERLRQRQSRPGLIVASPATRTRQTAELVAAAFDYPPANIALERQLYLAESHTLVGIIAAQPAGVDRLLVVGHNPGLTELVHELLPSFDVDDLPTGAVVALEYDGLADWLDIRNATSRLAYYDFPKNPREPATTR